jgi:hypothetical protein
LKQNQTQSGIGVSGLLFVALIILKLTGYVTMSWFWVVTSIVWIPFALVAVWLIVVAAIAGMALLIALLLEVMSK